MCQAHASDNTWSAISRQSSSQCRGKIVHFQGLVYKLPINLDHFLKIYCQKSLMNLVHSKNSIIGLNVTGNRKPCLAYLISDPPDFHIPWHQFDTIKHKPAMLGVDRSLKIPLFQALHQLETPYHGFLSHILIYASSRSLGKSISNFQNFLEQEVLSQILLSFCFSFYNLLLWKLSFGQEKHSMKRQTPVFAWKFSCNF